MDFTNKKILITGAGRGLGKVIASEFAKAGAHVAVHFNTSKQEAELAVLELEGENHTYVEFEKYGSIFIGEFIEHNQFHKGECIVKVYGEWNSKKNKLELCKIYTDNFSIDDLKKTDKEF